MPHLEPSKPNVEESRAVLLSHARHPRNHEKLEFFDAFGECRNPLCGDHIAVQLKTNSVRIEQVGLQISGCAIATASASLMGEVIGGLSKEAAARRMRLAIDTLSFVTAEWPEELKTLAALETVQKNPRKLACALIGWFALKAALESGGADVSAK